VLNTDTIHLVHSSSALPDVELQLDEGPFAPGATLETEGASDIEIDVRGGASLAVIGTPGNDAFRWVNAGGHLGLNLNADVAADRDADVTTDPRRDEEATLLVAIGGAGDDSIIGDGTAPVSGDAFTYGGSGNDLLGAFGTDGSYLNGEAGNDIITGSQYDDILAGGGGNDRISAKSGADRIFGGRGADRINAGAGRDVITARDATRDTVTCGSGRDRVDADRRDVLRGCEQRGRG
jgi:Ca2+-binding RTX toxin-like protein